ncbi:sugar MFS transporter [Thalassotalea marina]|uniref:MFS transporter n=1 Tax=Thalassotalea marina TaxID=1673741 RepID=A0A919BA51_9GAMM|nr:sugar MFS transporter [Thalassotalea marina]GHF77993.1 MFS transporter [Thalassotalea marina]
MAGASTPIEPSFEHPSPERSNQYGFALTSLTTLFFMWGFITCLNDILIPYLKGAFELSYTQAMLIQFCFFGAYFIVSIPAGSLVSKIGYQRGIVTGLTIAALGCLLFYPASELQIYAFFLIALFVLASGITILQVSANPYVSALGPAETASSRLTMTQAFNSLGTTIAPFFGAMLIFSGAEHSPVEDASAVQLPYFILTAALLLLALVFSRLSLPKLGQSSHAQSSFAKALQHKHLKLGAIAIFVYVGAEVAIGSFLVNYLNDPNIAGLSEAQASQYIAYYWGGAMLGRFVGAIVMQHISAGKVLFFNAIVAMLLIVITISSSGQIAMWAILAVGLFNSIMFPTIFSLAITGLGHDASRGSGILCLAIVGGAIVPLIQGMLADVLGLQLAFILPLVCYAYIAFYGLRGSTPCVEHSTKEAL